MKKMNLLIGRLLTVVAMSTLADNLVYCAEGSPSSFNPQIVSDGTSMNASAQTI